MNEHRLLRKLLIQPLDRRSHTTGSVGLPGKPALGDATVSKAMVTAALARPCTFRGEAVLGSRGWRAGLPAGSPPSLLPLPLVSAQEPQGVAGVCTSVITRGGQAWGPAGTGRASAALVGSAKAGFPARSSPPTLCTPLQGATPSSHKSQCLLHIPVLSGLSPGTAPGASSAGRRAGEGQGAEQEVLRQRAAAQPRVLLPRSPRSQ